MLFRLRAKTRKVLFFVTILTGGRNESRAQVLNIVSSSRCVTTPNYWDQLLGTAAAAAAAGRSPPVADPDVGP